MKLYMNQHEVSADTITPATTEPVVILREPGDTDADYERLGMQIEAQMYTDVERLTANLGTPSTRAFLDALFPFPDGCAEFRTVPPRVDSALYVALEDFDHAAIGRLAKRYNADQRLNFYVGMASRRDATSGKRDNCHRLGAIYADIDFVSEKHRDGVPEAEGRAMLDAFPVPPSAVVSTGGGLQAHWFLKTPIDLDDEREANFARSLLKALARALKADPVVAELVRVMRVPGTINYNYNPSRLAKLERLNVNRRYDVDDFKDALAPFMVDEHDPRAGLKAVIEHGVPLEQRIARARAYLAKIPGAIEGHGGDNATFRVTAHTVRGFDLPDDAALELLHWWNDTCVPKWSEDDLVKKIANVHAHASGPRGSMFIGDTPIVLPDDAVIEDMSRPVEPDPYTFAPAFPAGHFVSDYIAYASRHTDAAHEYHEAMALALLATVTPNLRAMLGPYPNGLPTNLYLLIVGDTTRSRKSTTKDQAVDVATHVNAGQLMPEKMTPEAFVEQLALRSPGSSLWAIDEFGQTLVEMHRRDHLKGLVGHMLKAYSGNDVTYARVSKKGNTDDLTAHKPHVTVVGCVTPLIFDALHESDIASGFLPRFAVVMPTSKPARRAFYEMQAGSGAERNALVKWLAKIRATTPVNLHGRPEGTPDDRCVTFERDALVRIDAFAEQLEARGSDSMLARLNAMAIKVAMLCAAGRPDAHERGHLRVTQDDADASLCVMQRWTGFAEAFSARMGENDHERKVTKCLEFMKGRTGFVNRSDVLRHVKTDAKDFANVEQTLVERGLIDVTMVDVVKRGTKVKKLWTLSKS